MAAMVRDIRGFGREGQMEWGYRGSYDRVKKENCL
jgi:hypothetical protein